MRSSSGPMPLAPPDRLQDLGPLTGPNSAATALNAYGWFAGERLVQSGASRAFVTSPVSGSVMTYGLGTLGGDESVATAVNAFGQVVGMADTGSAIHAFLFPDRGGAMRDLGTLGGENSSARAVNGRGHVVGTAQTGDGSAHAFLYDGSLIDLNTLVEQSAGWELGVANGINNAGWIVGFGFHSGTPASFVMTPA